MKPLIITLLLAGFTLPATANEHVNNCQLFARLAEVSANARDDGAVKSELIDLINEHPDMTETEKMVALASIDYVYTYPKLSPREEGNAAYDECMED